MTDQTATQAMQMRWDNDRRMDLRRRRADALVAEIMSAIGPFLSHDRDAREDAARAVHRLLTSQGAYVMTDHERAEAGLPPRDDKGWTEAELRAYEASMLHAMMAPITPPILLATEAKKPAQR